MQKKTKTLRQFMLAAVATAVLTACGGGGDKNSAPEFSQSVYNITGNEDTVITGRVTATDPDGDSIIYSVSSAASHGVLRINADGSFAYTPNKDYFGKDEVTITASDGTASSSAKIIFDIINVNDVPVLVRTDVTSGANGVTIGQIIVTDADNDPITFSIITNTQYGTLDLDSQTGAFTYTPYDLELLDDSFVVGFTDGIIDTPIEATIPLIPQFTTNADKLNYYYSSDFSHLKKAEAIVDSINDGVAINELNTELAQGYLLSGFIDRANSLLETGIDSLDTQARAYRDAVEVAITQNQLELAQGYNLESQKLYTQFIEERGTGNLTTADTQFFLKIVKNYIELGSFESAKQLTDYLLDGALKIVNDNNGVHVNAYGFSLTAFNQYTSELADLYVTDQTEQNKTNVITALNAWSTLALNTGVQNNTTTPVYTLKTYHLQLIAQLYDRINEQEKAREIMATALSMYTAVSYDTNYILPANQYAANALATTAIRGYLSTFSGLFESLYPDASDNIPHQLLLNQSGTTASQRQAAQREIARYRIYNRIIAGEPVSDVIATVETDFTANGGTLAQFVSALTTDNAQGQSVASRLYINGQQSAAQQTLAESLDLLKLPNYTLSNRASNCYSITKSYQQYNGDLAPAAAICQDLIDTFFQTDSSSSPTIINITAAYRDLISVYGLFNDNSAESALIKAVEELDTHIQKFDEIDDRINRYMINTPDLASISAFDLAQQFMNKGLALIDERLADETLTAAQLKTIMDALRVNIGNLYSSADTTPSRNYVNYIKALRRTPLTDNYPVRLASVYDELKKRVVAINAKAKTYAINDQQSFAASLVNLNLSADMIAEAHAIVDDPITAAAEKIAFLKAIGTHHSLLDHFPGTDVANVDSDNDGKPNFFLLHKTEEEIAASGLVADDDSDGDGVPDSEDLFPLDPTKP